MGLTVCVSSTDTSLTTGIQVLKDMLGLGTSTGNDGKLETALIRATDLVERYVGQPLRSQVYVETLGAFGGPDLLVGRTPIRTILRFAYGTDSGSWTTMLSTEYRLENPDAGLIERDEGFETEEDRVTFLTEAVHPRAVFKPWLIEYAAGFNVGITQTTSYGGDTGRDVPMAIEQAVLETAKSIYLSGRRDSNVLEQTVGPTHIKYAGADAQVGYSEVPPAARGYLQDFVRTDIL